MKKQQENVSSNTEKIKEQMNMLNTNKSEDIKPDITNILNKIGIKYFDNNFEKPKLFFDYCLKNKLTKIIFSSTGSIYGNVDKKNIEDLESSQKDKAENLMIVDLLRNDLGMNCKKGSVKVDKLFDIETFANVHHLVSTVRAELADGKDAVDQIHAAFPGGSITGAPKIRAMEIIEELEPHRRSVYCGSIGYLSACGNMDTSITII